MPAFLIAIILYGAAWLSSGQHIGLGVGFGGVVWGPRIHMKVHDASGQLIFESIEPLAVTFEGDSACVFNGVAYYQGQHVRYDARVDDAHRDQVFVRVDGRPIIDDQVTAGNLIVRPD